METLIWKSESKVISPGCWVNDSGSVWIGCPDCGAEINLSDHDISPIGYVRPQLDCPDCTWQVLALLEDWSSA